MNALEMPIILQAPLNDEIANDAVAAQLGWNVCLLSKFA